MPSGKHDTLHWTFSFSMGGIRPVLGQERSPRKAFLDVFVKVRGGIASSDLTWIRVVVRKQSKQLLFSLSSKTSPTRHSREALFPTCIFLTSSQQDSGDIEWCPLQQLGWHPLDVNHFISKSCEQVISLKSIALQAYGTGNIKETVNKTESAMRQGVSTQCFARWEEGKIVKATCWLWVHLLGLVSHQLNVE